MDHATYIGLVHNLPSERSVTILVHHPVNKTLTYGSWDLELPPFDPFQRSEFGISLKNEVPTYSDALRSIASFLRSHCDVSARMLIEYPIEETPANSTFSQLMACLVREGFGPCVIDFAPGSDILRFREVPEDQRPTGSGDAMWFIAPGKSNAYAMLLFNVDAGACKAKDIAFAASLIARNTHLYRYLKSRSSLFSSQDVAQYLQHPETCNPLLLSGDYLFYLSRTPDPPECDIEDMHLEYAVESKRFGFLPSGEAIKFAVLSVCKLVGYRMHCIPVSDPIADQLLVDEVALGPDQYVVYDPKQLAVAQGTTVSRG